MIGYKLRKLWKPAMFQGIGKDKNYFEGWYFKIVDKAEGNVYAIIPGISYGSDKYKSHAFIQIINGKTHHSNYFTFDIKDFSFSKNKFEIKISGNVFSANMMKINIDKDGKKIRGGLTYRNLIKWPSEFNSPGTMGWYTFVPFMQCYHECISLNHRIEGSLKIDGNVIDFNGGRGYIEKDWGKSFPSSWIWLQSNHFENNKASIMVSIANVPWLKGHFIGFIAGVWCKGVFYKFATYSGAKLKKIRLKDNKAYIMISDKKFELNIEIYKSEEGKLYSPINGAMVGEINESISATVNVSLFRLYENTKEKIFEDIGRNAGLEMMGDLDELVNKKQVLHY